MRSVIGLFFFTGLLFISADVLSQQDPIYALYIANPLVLNPAYAGITNNVDANVSFRNQWAGFDGHPQTLNASGHLSLADNKMGAGLQIVQDKIGENKNTSITGMYSYRIQVKENQFLSFGMQAALINFKTDPSELNLYDNTDPLFPYYSETKMNLGAGFLYKTDRFFAGFSVPRLFANSLNTNGNSLQIYKQSYYLLGTYLFYLSDRIIFKPALLVKGQSSSPISADVNLNINFDRKYTAGLYTRNFNAFGVLAQMQFLDQFKLSYAFEIPAGNSVGTRYTTNEIMIGIRTSIFDFHDSTGSGF
jgi:type IX secretion system PorP/SprF family membrane protein